MIPHRYVIGFQMVPQQLHEQLGGDNPLWAVGLRPAWARFSQAQTGIVQTQPTIFDFHLQGPQWVGPV